MAIKFQFNKTSLQTLNKALKMRYMALPIIKNKESALRLEVKRTKDLLKQNQQQLETKINTLEPYKALWPQFEFDLVKVSKTDLGQRKIAGVRIPTFQSIEFETPKVVWFNQSLWVSEAILELRGLVELQSKSKILELQVQILEKERKRTTQKVNLFEKVQIPEIENGIKKIKRFLEDEENLSKAAQKMVKSRNTLA
jgi:V/A-type H+-transporting ATPase subunit D